MVYDKELGEKYGLVFKIIFNGELKAVASSLNGVYIELSALWAQHKDDPDFKMTIEKAKEVK